MKVLVCATEYYPHGAGIANVAYNVVQELEKQGVECTVCSPTGPDIILGNPKLINKFGILGMLYYWHQVSRFFNTKHNKYDIIWLHNPFIVNKNPFKKCIVTMHSTYYGSYKSGFGNFFIRLYKLFVAYLERYCLTQMEIKTIFTGVGKNVCEELKKIGIPQERITYILNGVNTSKFAPSLNRMDNRKKFDIPLNDIVILSVGRITHQKNPFKLIEIQSLIEKRRGGVTLCVAGKGELLEGMKGYAKELSIKNIIFKGYVDDLDLPDLYACADYFITTTKYEGGMPPLNLAEAMASGLPCIVSDIPPLRIVKMADCGIMVNFEDTAEKNENIIEYISENNERQSINAREFAKEKLDWEIIAKDYLKLITDSIN